MALKIYCDRCGKETTTNFHMVLPLKKDIDLCGECEVAFHQFMQNNMDQSNSVSV